MAFATEGDSAQARLTNCFLCRDACQQQIDSIQTPFNLCLEGVLAYTKLDEYFVPFYEWAMSVYMPIIVLSAGLEPLIRALLVKGLGSRAEDIEIVANEVVVRDSHDSIDEEGGWQIRFRDDSESGNDKAAFIRLYAQHRDRSPESCKSILIYAGDGVSDLKAAGGTDLLFAKEGNGAL